MVSWYKLKVKEKLCCYFAYTVQHIDKFLPFKLSDNYFYHHHCFNLPKLSGSLLVFLLANILHYVISNGYISFLLITEVLDYGYPQKTDTGILKTYITQTGIRTQVREL